MALVGTGGLWFRYQVEQLAMAPPAPAPVRPRERHDRLYVGRITSLDCPRQPIGVNRVVCLQIEFADGRRERVERNTAEGQYLAPRSH